jgi:hypothetical protein
MRLVLVERYVPGHLLRRGVDLHRPGELPREIQHLASDRADRAVRRERYAPAAAGTVLDDRLVRMQVERDRERARSVGCRQLERLPTARGEPQRRVL